MQNQHTPLESESERAWRIRDFQMRIDQRTFQHRDASHSADQQDDEWFQEQGSSHSADQQTDDSFLEQDPLINHIKCPDCHSLEHNVGDTALAIAALMQRKKNAAYGLAMLVKDASATLNAIDESKDKLEDLLQHIRDSLEELQLNCGDCETSRRVMSPRTAIRATKELPSVSCQRAKVVQSAVEALSKEAFNMDPQQRGSLELWIEHFDRAKKLEEGDLGTLFKKLSTLGTATSARQKRFEPSSPDNKSDQQQQQPQDEEGRSSTSSQQQQQPDVSHDKQHTPRAETSVPDSTNDRNEEDTSLSSGSAISGSSQATRTTDGGDSGVGRADPEERPEYMKLPRNFKPDFEE